MDQIGKSQYVLTIIPLTAATILLLAQILGAVPTEYTSIIQTAWALLYILPFRFSAFGRWIGQKIGRTPSLRDNLDVIHSHAESLRALDMEVQEIELLLGNANCDDREGHEANLQGKLNQIKTLLDYVDSDLKDVKGNFRRFHDLLRRYKVRASD